MKYYLLTLLLGTTIYGVANSISNTFGSGWLAGILATIIWRFINETE